MPEANDFTAAFFLGCIFFGGVAFSSAFWGLHCRMVRKRISELEEARRRAVEKLLPLAQKEVENVKSYRKEIEDLRALVSSHDDALQNANKQMLRRLNALTDVVDEIRNGSFTMQWEKKND